MKTSRWIFGAAVVSFLYGASAFAADAIPANGQVAGLPKKPVVPYETFIEIQNYQLQNSGIPGNQIHNVHVELTFPNGKKITLPEGGQDWPIANGQMQPINLTYKIPFKYIQNDGFTFTLQMVRRGADLQPCVFKVDELSQFNRSYVCRTDTNWQSTQRVPEEKWDKEAVQVRVSTDIKENLAGKAEGASLAAKQAEIPTKFITIE